MARAPLWGWVPSAFLAAVACITMAGGCQSVAERKVDDDLAMAEKAKAALVALARVKPPVFLEGLDPDRLESTPVIKSDEAHVYCVGRFSINVKNRRYAADIGNLDWHQWYRGTFTLDAGGRWTAEKPEVSFADALPKQP